MKRPADLGIGEERLDPSEDAVVDDFIAYLTAHMAEKHPAGRMPRSVQTKQHGCVRAEFAVEPGLPDAMKVGLFATERTYPAFVRFASQEPTPQHDAEKDIRGMSIKVCNVPGETILGGTTQDFVLISTEVFVTADTEAFLRLRKASEPRSIPKLLKFFLNPFDLQIRALKNVIRARGRHHNPLYVRYFSATPYRFGDGAVKYAATPRKSVPTPAEARSEHFLRESMAATLRDGAVVFDLGVQPQIDPVKMPVEDAGAAWSEADSPFQRVATVTIPQQIFDSPAQMEFGDNLAFTPWNCLPDHRPLGGVNRARLRIYQAMEKQRRERNQAPRTDPTGTETFD